MWEPNLGRLWAHPMPLKKNKIKKKPKNLPKSSKNVGNFITFFLKCSNVFGNFQNVPLTMLLGIFLI